MKINQYISVFLLMLFLTKFLVVDAKMLSMIAENDQVVYVNPFCEKNKHLNFDSAELIIASSISEVIYLVAPCVTAFQFKTSHWAPVVYEPLSTVLNFGIPLIEGLYHGQNYPPPRVA
ncbi:hypothetical protein ACFS1K_13290 [Arenibacter antarcticus]|uniref:Uncharacterized protein n=2 Tax=Flavobacteriaceae TaxID=49546 RepID=A0ABW5VGJ5_9FLAO